MTNETYQYQGKQVAVTAFQKTDQPEVWDFTIRIDGVLQVLTDSGTYPPKHFPSSEDATEYGKQAAEYLIDHRI